MTAAELQKTICKQEILKGNIPCENITPNLVGECDVLSIRKSGYIVEYEIKISRSDYIADTKKDKWRHFELRVETNIPNYFYYVCPEGLIQKEELEDYMGLIYISPQGETKEVKKSKLLHRHKHDLLNILTKMCRIKSEREYLGCALLTYNNNIIKERNNAKSKQKDKGQPI